MILFVYADFSDSPIGIAFWRLAFPIVLHGLPDFDLHLAHRGAVGQLFPTRPGCLITLLASPKYSLNGRGTTRIQVAGWRSFTLVIRRWAWNDPDQRLSILHLAYSTVWVYYWNVSFHFQNFQLRFALSSGGNLPKS